MTPKTDVMDMVSQLKQRGEAFVVATVERTVAETAAKAGAKAVIMPDGTILGGWIGGRQHRDLDTFGDAAGCAGLKNVPVSAAHRHER